MRDRYGTSESSSEKSWVFRSYPGGASEDYVGGFYAHTSGAEDFDAISAFVGTIDAAQAAHVYIVTGAEAANEVTIRVSSSAGQGNSINDDGVSAADTTEDIVIPAGTPANSYFETKVKWNGIAVIDLVTGTAILCNYGLAKYWDNNNSDFTVEGVEFIWRGGAADTAADLQLCHHKNTGWTYNVASTATPPAAICSMAADHGTDGRKIIAGKDGAYKRANLNQPIRGGGSEGTMLRIDSGANGTFAIGTAILRIRK